MCYAPVDLKESFEFVRKVALNGKNKEIMAMNGMGKAAIKDIRKKQSAYIKELLIELVTNEITEISTREVVNVLGEPV